MLPCPQSVKNGQNLQSLYLIELENKSLILHPLFSQRVLYITSPH